MMDYDKVADLADELEELMQKLEELNPPQGPEAFLLLQTALDLLDEDLHQEVE